MNGSGVPKGEEDIIDDPYDLLSRITPEVQLLRDTLPADSPQSTYARITLHGNRGETQPGTVRSQLSAYILIDHSTTMDELDMAKTTALVMLEGLQSGDRVTVVACGKRPRLIAESVEKGSGPLAWLERKILALEPEEGCDMVGSVVMAGWRAKQEYAEGKTLRIFVLSAGHADDKHGLIHVVRDLAKECVYVHVYSYGREANSELLIAMVNAGGGQYHRISTIDQINDIVAAELTQNSIAGKHVRLCIRPRHASVEVLEIFDFEYVREEDTFIIDIGDIYRATTVDILVKIAYKCPPGRKDVLEVHVSHHDTNDERHLRTFVLPAVFVIDPAEVQAALPYSLVVDKVMKVNTALALVLADQAVQESDQPGAIEILNTHVQRLAKNQSLGGDIVSSLQEDLKGYIAAYDDTGTNLNQLRCTVLSRARALYRE